MICIKFLLLVAVTINVAKSRSIWEEPPFEHEDITSNRSAPSKEGDDAVIDERDRIEGVINGKVKDEEAINEKDEDIMLPPITNDDGEGEEEEEEATNEREQDDDVINENEEELMPPQLTIDEDEEEEVTFDREKGDEEINGGEEEANPTPTQTTIASDAINDFTLDMLKIALSKKKGENVIMSPYSIHAALRMLAAGSKTVSQRELEKALRTKTSDLESFEDLDDQMEPEADEIRFDVANKVFVDKRVKLLESYEEILMDTMNAEVGVEDFKGKPEKSRQKVNKWVEEKTENMIKELFPSGSLDSTTELVIANAVFYKALWKEPFDTKNTEKSDFQLENGTKVPCDLMFKNAKFPSIWDEMLNMQVVRIPYTGDEYDFVAAIPDIWPTAVPLSEKESEISSKTVKGWLNSLKKRANNYIRNMDVFLPKFKAELEMDLEESLKEMGITSIFGSEADLSGITGSRNLYVGSARHKAFIEVNEAGTKAAAATGFGVSRMSMPMQVRLDRPFLYFIVHRESNTIIFSGRMSNPSA